MLRRLDDVAATRGPAFATSAPPAAPQPEARSVEASWRTKLAFALGNGVPLASGALHITATGTYTFVVRAGIFDVAGLGPEESNCGLNHWAAKMTASGLGPDETLGVVAGSSRIPPFNFGPATSFGGTLVAPDTIDTIIAARDVSGGATVPWHWDSGLGQPGPQPTAPTQDRLGANSFTRVYRFTVTINTLSGDDIKIYSVGQAGPIIRWVMFSATEPDETTPGVVSFLGLVPRPVVRSHVPPSLRLIRGADAERRRLLG